MQHSLWNMYAQIQNGLLARKKSVCHSRNSFCLNILKVLYKEGYINGFRLLPTNSKKIEIFLKYSNGKPVLTQLTSPSKPGRRVYMSAKTLWKLNTSLGTLIVSTPRGILSDKECRKLNCGGEILGTVF